jgi:hypothetical protein
LTYTGGPEQSNSQAIGQEKNLKITKKLLSSLALASVVSIPVFADAIPYPNPGVIAPTNMFTAASTGHIEGYFYGFNAADVDEIRMCDTTQGYCSPYTFQNQTTPVGATFNFGAVHAGDVLVFDLNNLTTGNVLSSDPSRSADGINHAYATPYTMMVNGIPAPGTFIGMEDLTVPGSDLDYNDDQFVFNNISSTTVTPEPSSIGLLGMGLLCGVMGAARRKFKIAHQPDKS